MSAPALRRSLPGTGSAFAVPSNRVAATLLLSSPVATVPITIVHPPSSPRPPPVPPPTTEGRDALIEGVVHLHGAADSLGRVERHQAAGVARGRPVAWFSKTNPRHDGGLGNGSVAATHSFRAVLARQYPTPMVIVAAAPHGIQLRQGHSARRRASAATVESMGGVQVGVAPRTFAQSAAESPKPSIVSAIAPPPIVVDVGELAHGLRPPLSSTEPLRDATAAFEPCATGALRRITAVDGTPSSKPSARAVTSSPIAGGSRHVPWALVVRPYSANGKASPPLLAQRGSWPIPPQATRSSMSAASPATRSVAVSTSKKCARARGLAIRRAVGSAGSRRTQRLVRVPQVAAYAQATVAIVHPPSSSRQPPVPPPTTEGNDALIEGVVHLHGAANSLGRVERHQTAGVVQGRPADWFSKTNPRLDGELGSGSVASTHSFRAVSARQYPTPMATVVVASTPLLRGLRGPAARAAVSATMVLLIRQAAAAPPLDVWSADDLCKPAVVVALSRFSTLCAPVGSAPTSQWRHRTARHRTTAAITRRSSRG